MYTHHFFLQIILCISKTLFIDTLQNSIPCQISFTYKRKPNTKSTSYVLMN